MSYNVIECSENVDFVLQCSVSYRNVVYCACVCLCYTKDTLDFPSPLFNKATKPKKGIGIRLRLFCGFKSPYFAQ